MNIQLVHFNAKLAKEDIFKPTIGNESLHEDINYNGVRIVNIATTEYLVVKGTMFTHRNFHKYTWTSTDGKTHNQTDHILIDRRWHSSILNVRSFREADCDTDHCLVVTTIRERLAVSRIAAQNFDEERLNFRKQNKLEVRIQYHIKISNKFAALEKLSDSEDIIRAWKNV